MKTIYVESADIIINDKVVGSVEKIDVNGSIEIYGSQANVWVNIPGNGLGHASKQLVVKSGVSEDGVNWAQVEAEVLSQLGLTKLDPQPSVPVAPAPIV